MSPRGGKRSGSGRPKLNDGLKKITIKISVEQHEKLKAVKGYNALIRKFLDTL